MTALFHVYRARQVLIDRVLHLFVAFNKDEAKSEASLQTILGALSRPLAFAEPVLSVFEYERRLCQ